MCSGPSAQFVLLLSAPKTSHPTAQDTRGVSKKLAALGAAHRPECRRSQCVATTRKTNQLTNFSDLGLAAPILKALQDEGYTVPTPIQAKAIPGVLAGRDLLGHRPDRHRQDRRLRPADPAPPGRRPPARAAQGLPRAGAHPDPRAGQPDRGQLPHLRPPSRRDRRGRVRRRRPSAADPGAGARRRRAGRHAGPAHRPPHRSATSCSPAPRSWCSTRPTRCWTSASCRRSAASSPS